MSDNTVNGYDGHCGEMPGVRCYGDHCKGTDRACVRGSLELATVNGVTHLLQDYIRRGICEVNVDEWDDGILVQVIVYDDVVAQSRYKTVRDMFPSTVTMATRDNKKWEKLSKPVNVLVELGSKDSVEYKNSEEYKKEQADKTEKQQMTNQLMLSQVRLVYEYLCDETARCKNGSAPLSLLSHQHVLETARNGLFMIVRAMLGEGYDEEKKTFTYPEGVPLAAMPKEAREICEEFDKKAAEAASKVFAAEDKEVTEKIDLNEIVETAVDIQRKEVFSIAKFHPDVREDYRMTNDWYGGDTVARRTAIVRFDAPEGDGMEFKKKLFEAFGLFYRKYASPMYTISVDTVVLKGGAVGVMLHARFHDDVRLSDEDLAVVQECNMAHWFAGDAPVPVGCEQRKRYSGDAMIRDDISRHSRYDLKGVDFRIPLVEWVDSVDGHDVWRAFVAFLIEGRLTESSFKFSEAGSAIANSAKAFDHMVSCLPNLGLRLKEGK